MIRPVAGWARPTKMTEQLQKPVFRILHHPEASIYTERPESRLTQELYQQYQCPALCVKKGVKRISSLFSWGGSSHDFSILDRSVAVKPDLSPAQSPVRTPLSQEARPQATRGRSGTAQPWRRVCSTPGHPAAAWHHRTGHEWHSGVLEGQWGTAQLSA